MLCSMSSKYMIDACLYLGKEINTSDPSLANYYVKELTKGVHGSNQNITMTNWFTSIPLAEAMLQKLYDHFRHTEENKKEIPSELE